MKPLIDGDMLLYEVGFGVEYKDDSGNHIISQFDRAVDLLEQKLREIYEDTWSDEDSILYLTGDTKLMEVMGLKDMPLNFRAEVAVTKPYKGNRTGNKPFHYDNLRVYMLNFYDTKVAWGMEADDLLAIDHTANLETTVLCSRDKDLRTVPGFHYGWPCGKQYGFGPREIDELGYLELDGKGKLTGGGFKFFCAQLIMGDTVDNIPGIPRGGPKLAYKLLKDCDSNESLLEVVKDLYESKMGEGWEEYFREQADLLWICRELNDNEPVRFNYD